MSRESDRCTGCRHQAADDITGCLRQDCSDSWPVQKLRAEVARLTAENAAHLEYRAKELQHLQQLVGSPTWKKVVEGSRNPNFMTLQEKMAAQAGEVD